MIPAGVDSHKSDLHPDLEQKSQHKQRPQFEMLKYQNLGAAGIASWAVTNSAVVIEPEQRSFNPYETKSISRKDFFKDLPRIRG